MHTPDEFRLRPVGHMGVEAALGTGRGDAGDVKPAPRLASTVFLRPKLSIALAGGGLTVTVMVDAPRADS